MLVEENGKIYVVEDNKVVAAMEKDAYYGDCPHPECEDYGTMKYDLGAAENCDKCGTSMRIVFPKEKKDEKEGSVELSFDFGDRVEYREDAGSVISIIPSMYGNVIGVKFDDGDIQEFDASQLEKIETPAPIFASDIEALSSEYNEYSEMPANTLREVEKKQKVSRGLNLRAKSLITDSTLPLSDRIELDSIVTATGVDTMDLQTSKTHLLEAEAGGYLDNQPKYELGKEFAGNRANRSGEDISWVAGLKESDVNVDNWDERLLEMANDATSSLTVEDVQNESFMKEVKSFLEEVIPSKYHEQFAVLLKNSTDIKEAELLKEEAPEEAPVETFADVMDEALYL